MRATTVNTLCILALGSILTIGFNAAAQVDPNMEAAVACSDADCMFRGNPQTHDNLGALNRVTLPGGAHMYNVNRFQNNPDQVVNRVVETQYAPVGELQSTNIVKNGTSEAAMVGSAFLVSPCYIMTAAHVVYGDELSPTPGKDYSMQFRAGTSASSAFAGKTIATPVASGDRDAAGGNDWAIMKLNNCVGKRAEFGWFEVAQSKAKELVGKTLVSVGYAADRARGELSMGLGKATGTDTRNDLLKFSGSMSPGQSGGPVLAMENGSIKVAAINVAEMGKVHGATYSSYSADHANLVLSASEILNRPYIKAILDADKADFGQANPASQRMTRSLTHTQMASK